MPARLNPRHSDMVRQKIQASVIVDRLHKHFMGEIELSTTQLRAAEALLDRSVAKLSQVQHVGPDGGPIEHRLSILTDKELEQLEQLASKLTPGEPAAAGADPGGEGEAPAS